MNERTALFLTVLAAMVIKNVWFSRTQEPQLPSQIRVSSGETLKKALELEAKLEAEIKAELEQAQPTPEASPDTIHE